MGANHTGNVQPAIDREEHEHTLEPATKRVLTYGYDGSEKQIFRVDSNGNLLTDNFALAVITDEADANTTYVGEAPVGTATNEAKWSIKKIVVSGTVTQILYADGDTKFDNVWDNRTSLTYS